MRIPLRLASLLALAVLLPGTHLQAQQSERILVDSIAIEGVQRVAPETVRGYLGFEAGDSVGSLELARAQKTLWEIGQFTDIRVFAEGAGTGLIRIVVDEAPLIRSVRVTGLEHADPDLVQDSAGVRPNTPVREQNLIRARTILRRRLADEGIPFASIDERIIAAEGMINVVDIVIDVEEGNRVTVAEVSVEGNENVPTEDIVSAMEIRPEGFWWFRSGSYEEDAYESDVLSRIPDLYRSRGYLDAQVVSDTLIVDPTNGKARIELIVDEGPQYRVGALSLQGNRFFEDEELEPYLLPRAGGILSALGIGGSAREEEALGRVFDQPAFAAALEEIRGLYYNEGYIYSQIQEVIEKRPPGEEGADPTVALTVQIQEGQPAYLREVAIEGNDYTYERVIRNQIVVLPGDLFRQDLLLQSYQSINALGFFETPLPFPDIQTDPETGDVDVTFFVQERQTGAVNFGTSVGGGIGLSGFIGYDQPNLFGQAKEGHLRWDFGRYVNNFTISFTDPALFQTRTSGTISLYNARDRFFSFNSGERRRIGADLRLGFPIPGARWTRAFVGYSISRTKYRLRQGVDDTSLFGLSPGTQSQMSLGITRSRLNHPIFPTSGSRQSWNVEFNGGLLGGDGKFTRHLVEGTWWLPIGQAGGSGPNNQGAITFALGTSLKGGAVFGNAERFPFDRFWMGGVQFGQQLRGYDETSVTPLGFFPENARNVSDIDRLGDAFMSVSTELAMRLNNSISVSTFFDAGNVWREPAQIDASKLFRGAGVGVQLVTPFGPIGVDYAYGFDKTTPGWQLHFRMGPGF